MRQNLGQLTVIFVVSRIDVAYVVALQSGGGTNILGSWIPGVRSMFQTPNVGAGFNYQRPV